MVTFRQYITENNIETGEEHEEVHFPDGVYISVKLSEETELAVKEYQEKYLKGQKINTDLHCSLIYSKKPQVEEIEPAEYTAVGTFKEFNLFGENKDALVAEINSQDLLKRNEALVQEYKFISEFDDYKPHITLSYSVENLDLNLLPAMDFAFKFQDEAIESLDTNWGSSSEARDEYRTLVGKAMAKLKLKEKDSDKKEKEGK